MAYKDKEKEKANQKKRNKTYMATEKGKANRRAYQRAYRAAGKGRQDPESVRVRQLRHIEKVTLDHYLVYYIPEKNYCGVTKQPHRRFQKYGFSLDDIGEKWLPLYATECQYDAYVHEAKFQIELGMNGHHEISKINNKIKL